VRYLLIEANATIFFALHKRCGAHF
jgi:hypothetical protein